MSHELYREILVGSSVITLLFGILFMTLALCAGRGLKENTYTYVAHVLLRLAGFNLFALSLVTMYFTVLYFYVDARTSNVNGIQAGVLITIFELIMLSLVLPSITAWRLLKKS